MNLCLMSFRSALPLLSVSLQFAPELVAGPAPQGAAGGSVPLAAALRLISSSAQACLHMHSRIENRNHRAISDA